MARLARGAKCGSWGESVFRIPCSVPVAQRFSLSKEASARVPMPVAQRPKNWRRVTARRLWRLSSCGNGVMPFDFSFYSSGTIQRPVNLCRASKKVLRGHRPEKPAVVAVRGIVPKDEIRASWNLESLALIPEERCADLELRARYVLANGQGLRLLHGFSIVQQPAILDGDAVAGQSDDSFHIKLPVLGGIHPGDAIRSEHNHVPTLRLGEPVGAAAYEKVVRRLRRTVHSFALALQCRTHGSSRDLKRAGELSCDFAFSDADEGEQPGKQEP